MNKLTGSVKSAKELKGSINSSLSITANITSRGPRGPSGESMVLTHENVTKAIGYIPVNEEKALQEADINLLF